MSYTCILDDDEENPVIINLSSDTRIFGGERAWELQRFRISKGKSEWRSYKWFHSLSAAVREAASHEIRTDPAEGLNEALDAVCRVTERYDNLVDQASRQIAERAERKLRAVA